MSDSNDSVDKALKRFGLPAATSSRPHILHELHKQVLLEVEDDDEGDQFLMRLLCAQLFSIGIVDDSLAIWAAKSCNFDTMLGIDVQFLCGAGLEQTKQFLRSTATEESLEALRYINDCEVNGDFERYPLERVLEATKAYYNVN